MNKNIIVVIAILFTVVISGCVTLRSSDGRVLFSTKRNANNPSYNPNSSYARPSYNGYYGRPSYNSRPGLPQSVEPQPLAEQSPEDMAMREREKEEADKNKRELEFQEQKKKQETLKC
jgi:hypothetical protein